MPIIQPTALLKYEYELTLDAYSGSGGFAHGAYLTQFGREYDFKSRQAMSAYNNLLRPIVNAKVNPVFADNPAREYEPNPIVEGFLENADNNQTSLKDMTHHAVTETELVGNSFIVMDNFPANEIPDTLNDVVDERKYPYVYPKSVLDVYEYQLDVFGKLEVITFYYGIYEGGEFADDLLYKRFTKKDIEYFTIRKEKNKTTNEIVEIFNTISVTNHDLGIVPVAYYNSEVLPFPPYYSMATMLRRLYNLDSEIADLGRTQMFSILLIPSTHMGGEPQDNIVISTTNALFYDSQATNSPSYISPDSSIMSVQLEQRDKYYDAIIQQADLLGTSASKNNSSKSGNAYSYEFFGKMNELKRNSDISNNLEEQIIMILGRFMGVEIEYTVSYTSTFSPTFTETDQKVNLLIKVSDMEISDLVTSNVQADIVSLIGQFMEWDDEKITKAIGSVVEVSQIV